MRVAEAKRRRFLRLAGAMALVFAPSETGVAALERAELRMPPPRPGSIPISAAALAPEPPLELEAPDLIGLALRSEVAGGWERTLPNAAGEPRAEASALSELAPLGSASPAGAPVAEPPAAVLLGVAAGSWLAARRSRQAPKRGGRFSRNASMPSTASESSRLSAITAPASR
jgi:hypothetical protein